MSDPLDPEPGSPSNGSEDGQWGPYDTLKTSVRIKGVCPGDMTPMCAKDCLASGVLSYLEDNLEGEAELVSVGFPGIPRSHRHRKFDASFPLYIRLLLSLDVAAKLASVSGAATGMPTHAPDPTSPEVDTAVAPGAGYLELPPPWGGAVVLDDWGVLPHEMGESGSE